MAKSLAEVINEQKLNTATKVYAYLKGKTITILAPPPGRNQSGHAYGSPGTKVVAVNPSNFYSNGVNSTLYLRASGGNVYVYEVGVSGNTMKDLKDERAANEQRIRELEKEINEIDNKTDYLKTNGLEEYDERLFKVMDMISVIDDNKLDKAARAKALMSLLND